MAQVVVGGGAWCLTGCLGWYLNKPFAIGSSVIYVLFNAVVYLDSQLSSANQLHYFPDDYRKLSQSPISQWVFGLHVLIITPYLLSEANTYIKKAVRYHAHQEIRVIPKALASASASMCAGVKSLTSNLSVGLSLAALTHWLFQLSGKTDDSQAQMMKWIPIVLVNVLTLPSTFLTLYAVGHNEVTSSTLSPCLKKTLQVISNRCSAGAHSMIANTPNILMYALEGHAFTGFMDRLLKGQTVDDFSLSPVIWLISLGIHLCLSSSMEIGYNVKYEREVEVLNGVLKENGHYQPLSDNHSSKESCFSRVMGCQRSLIRDHSLAVNGAAVFYKSLIMSLSVFKLTYLLCSDVPAFERGEMSIWVLSWASGVALLNALVCLPVNSAFLLERREVEAVPSISPNPSDA